MSGRAYPTRFLFLAFVAAAVLGVVGCGKSKVTEVGLTLNGTCVTCHSGITNPHPTGAAIACVKCHGGDATERPFFAAFDEAKAKELLTQIADPEAPAGSSGRFVFDPAKNPTVLADDAIRGNALNGQVFFPEGRNDPAFQVLLTSAHNLPKGCAGPRETFVTPRLTPVSIDLNNDGIVGNDI